MDLPLAMPLFGGIALLWALFTLLQSALALGRIRVPAFLWWAFPALLLTAGGLAAWYDAGLTASAVSTASTDVAFKLRANGYAMVLENIVWVGTLTALGASLSALLFALSGIVRVGAFGRFKALHLIPGLLAIPLVLLGVFGGWQLSVAVFVGALAMTIASARLGTGADRRRGMANRGLVAGSAAAAPIALALAHYASARSDWFEAWAFASYSERSHALLRALDGLPFQLAADLIAAACLGFLGFCTLLPAVRAVLDTRAAGGFLFSVFLGALPIGAIAFGVAPTLSYEGVDELQQRRAALADAGIELVSAEVLEPWAPRSPLTVGLYWATRDGERLVPFKDGRVTSDRLSEGALIEPMSGSLSMEIDRRVDMRRLGPLLLAARRDDAEVCIVYGTTPWSCMPLDLTEPGDRGTHLLLRNIDATLMPAEGEPLVIDLATDRERIAQVEGPLVVHADENLTAERFLTAMAALHAIHPHPKLVLPTLR